MPTEPHTLTLAEVIHRGAEVADPTAVDDGVAQLLARFEDSDEPITAIGDPEQVILEGKGAIDPQDDEPVVTMAAAVAIYLAHRREAFDTGREELLRLAARAEYDGKPPQPIADWLDGEGVTL